MSFSRFWSRQEIASLQPGRFAKTDQPSQAKWRIVSIVSNAEFLIEKSLSRDGKRPAYTSIKIMCQSKAYFGQEVFMRVYKQVPYSDSEIDDLTTPEARSQQACQFVPEELIALKTFSENPEAAGITPRLLGWKESTQDELALVPGGFMTWIAWEKVPGVPLGDGTGSATFFWGLARHERDEIRRVFRTNLARIERVGIWQAFTSPSRLIWNHELKLLIFIGWREWSRCSQIDWSPIAFLMFDLARAPNHKYHEQNWDGDISMWTF